MLGKNIDIDITTYLNSRIGNSSILSPVNVGYINEGSKYVCNLPVYILGVTDPVIHYKAKIVAYILDSDDEQIGLVACPIGEHIYEPEIRQVLSVFWDGQDVRYYCMYEKSCGIVIYRRNKNIQYLLIRNRNGKYWSFPKGHIELGETEEQTAVREVLEETALSVSIMGDFRETAYYNPRGRIQKDVIFFLAEADRAADVIIQESEIEKYRWVDYQSAMNLFIFENDKRVITAARKWLIDNYKI